MVSEKLCEERNGNLVKRVDKLETEKDYLKEAVIKLTQIVEQITKENEQKKITQSDIKSQTVKPWQTKWFEWIVKSVCVIAVLLTMAAIGFNYFKEYLAVLVKG